MNEEEWMELSPSAMLEKWYAEIYESTTYSGLAGLGQRLAHQSLERQYSKEFYFETVLEVGGNRGEHLEFVRHSFGEYLLSDLVLPQLDDRRYRSLEGRITAIQADVQDLPLEDNRIDRVVVTCVLHHLPDPERALNEIRRVLKPGGRADIYMPSDPGLMYRFARALGPSSTAARQGLRRVKSLVDARDHRNHALGLTRLVRHTFREDLILARTYPLPGLTWNSSLWTSFRIQKLEP